VIPPNDPSALASAIAELARDPELALSYGANGRRYVEENLQWSKLISSWVKHLEVPHAPRGRRRREAQTAKA
jgi:glycosyltransferase involved in cell wall biosynthesis